MSLRITENNGTFLITGNINTATVGFFQKHIELLLDVHGEVTIDIENTISIEESGRRALKELYMYSLIYNKSFFIAGEGCEELYHHFSYDKVA